MSNEIVNIQTILIKGSQNLPAMSTYMIVTFLTISIRLYCLYTISKPGVLKQCTHSPVRLLIYKQSQ